MKNPRNIEMKIYELLGVKVFRKIAFTFRDIIVTPLLITKSKEERKNFLYNTASNYCLGKVKSLEDVKRFKKQIFINTKIHIYGLLALMPLFPKIINGTATLFTTIVAPIYAVLNIYCLMLQRYNNIRINQFIKKWTPRYEKQKDIMKDELRKEDSLLLEHTYKVVDKKKRETNITFENLIADASIEQLNQYREYLQHFQTIDQSIQENEFHFDKQQVNVSMPMGKKKTLKLEFKNNIHNNCTNN